jgi:cysteine dioxygenase
MEEVGAGMLHAEEKVVPSAAAADDVKTLQDVIDELHKIYDEDEVDVDHVKSVLESYTSRPKDWRKYVNFDAYRYTRNLVDEGNGKFNLMLLCWGEGHASQIHDHSDAHCFVKVLAGQLRETIYEWPCTPSDSTASASSASAPSVSVPSSSASSTAASPSSPDPGQPMQEKEILNYTTDQVTYINDSMGLHRVENPSHSDRTISLHLYTPPFGTCNLFDFRTGQKRLAHMTYWSRNGKLELSVPDVHVHESAMQPRPLNGLLSKIGC